jgi:4-hydroxy-tetrahydrodipicolinate reductase
MPKLKILLNGAGGKMGKAMAAGILAEKDMEIVAAVDLKFAGADLGLLAGFEPNGVLIDEDLANAIKNSKPDIMLDFTNPQAIMKNLRIAIPMQLAAVVGTTGLSAHDLAEVESLAKAHHTSVFVATNFALGAVLMMRFAAEAACYFPHVEIIELHHDQKLDAPSGTALTTLEMIAEQREVFAQGAPNEFEKIPGSRGGDFQGARVHSVRLPGYVASQEVLFGGMGQILSLRHDAMSRDCFLPGVLLALRKVKELQGLVIGLEKIM